MKVIVFNKQTDLKIQTSKVKTLVREVVSHEKQQWHEVTIHLVSQKRICQLHVQFFEDASPTDCISFPMDDCILGEIFVCPKTGIEYAERHAMNPYEEVTLYIVHGLLHLMGYRDSTSLERRRMRRAERRHMKNLKKLHLVLYK
jgi:probable rRNA maturation factor